MGDLPSDCHDIKTYHLSLTPAARASIARKRRFPLERIPFYVARPLLPKSLTVIGGWSSKVRGRVANDQDDCSLLRMAKATEECLQKFDQAVALIELAKQQLDDEKVKQSPDFASPLF